MFVEIECVVCVVVVVECVCEWFEDIVVKVVCVCEYYFGGVFVCDVV